MFIPENEFFTHFFKKNHFSLGVHIFFKILNKFVLKIPLKFIQSYTRGVMISKMEMASFFMNGLMGPCVGAVKHFTTIFQFFGVKLVLVG